MAEKSTERTDADGISHSDFLEEMLDSAPETTAAEAEFDEALAAEIRGEYTDAQWLFAVTPAKDINELVPKPSFLASYMDWSKSCEADPFFHLACGLTVQSVALGNRVYVPGFGGNKIFGHIWVLLIGQSTVSYKTTAQSFAMRLIDRQNDKLILESSFSPEGLTDALMKQEAPHGVLFIHEMGRLLKQIGKQDYMAHAPDQLAEMYDPVIGFGRALSSSRRRVRDPALCINGAVQPETFSRVVTSADFEGGFWARWMFFEDLKDHLLEIDENWQGYKSHGAMSDPLVEPMLAITKAAETVTGCVPLSDAAVKMYSEWLRRHKREVLTGRVPVRMSPLWGRLEANVAKIALGLQVLDLVSKGSTKSTEITVWNLSFAIKLIQTIKYRMVSLLGRVLVSNPKGRDIHDVRVFLQKLGEVSQADLMRHEKFSTIGRRRILEIRATLEESREITVILKGAKAKGPGRPSDLWRWIGD